MTYFVLQTALLLLAAYLIGAALGCLLRSLFQDIEDASAVRVRSGEYAGAGTHERVIETQGVSSSTNTGASNTSVSNTGVSSGIVAGSAAAMAAATVAAAANAVPEPVAEPEPEPVIEPAPVAKPEPVVEVEPVGEKVELKTSAAIAAAGVGVGVVAAAVADTAAPVADDLKRIRGIGPDVEEYLLENDIREYSQIANWSAADIARFSPGLNAEDRISRENWIEQAQILSTGGLTDYAKRVDRGEVPVDYRYEANEIGSGSGSAVAGASASTAGGAVESLAAVTATGAVAAATGGAIAENRERALRSERAAREPRSEREPREPREPREARAEREPREPREGRGEREPRASRGQSDGLVSTRRGDVPLRSVRSDALADSEPRSSSQSGDGGVARVQSTDHVDDLKQIKGVGVSLEKKLNAAGITTFEQIARWNAGDIAEMNKVLSFQGRVERENWIDQAHVLAQGGHTEFSQRVTRGEVQSSREEDDA